jgi:hypothetical protein
LGKEWEQAWERELEQKLEKELGQEWEQELEKELGQEWEQELGQEWEQEWEQEWDQEWDQEWEQEWEREWEQEWKLALGQKLVSFSLTLKLELGGLEWGLEVQLEREFRSLGLEWVLLSITSLVLGYCQPWPGCL